MISFASIVGAMLWLATACCRQAAPQLRDIYASIWIARYAHLHDREIGRLLRFSRGRVRIERSVGSLLEALRKNVRIWVGCAQANPRRFIRRLLSGSVSFSSSTHRSRPPSTSPSSPTLRPRDRGAVCSALRAAQEGRRSPMGRATFFRIIRPECCIRDIAVSLQLEELMHRLESQSGPTFTANKAS